MQCQSRYKSKTNRDEGCYNLYFLKKKKKKNLTSYWRIRFSCLFPPIRYKDKYTLMPSLHEPINNNFNSFTGKNFFITKAERKEKQYVIKLNLQNKTKTKDTKKQKNTEKTVSFESWTKWWYYMMKWERNYFTVFCSQKSRNKIKLPFSKILKVISHQNVHFNALAKESDTSYKVLG